MSSSLAPISLVHHLRNPPQGDLHSRPRQHSCRQPISPSCSLSRIHHIPSGSTGVVSPSVSGRRTVRVWTNLYGYAFPPPVLLSRVIAKVRREEATLLLLVHLARQALVLRVADDARSSPHLPSPRAGSPVTIWSASPQLGVSHADGLEDMWGRFH